MLSFIKRHRHWFILPALLLLLALLLGWLGVSTVRDAADRTRKTILQDVSDSSIALETGTTVEQQLTLTENCYGFLLAFDTHASIVQGTVEVSLLDEAGNLLASAVLNTAELKDKEIAPALFSDGIEVNGELKATLRLKATPATAEDTVQVLSTKEAAQAIGQLRSNGKAVQGSLYLQQLTAYAGAHGTLYRYFVLVGVVAAVLLAGGYLLIFVKKVKLHQLFLFLCLASGVLMMLVLPPMLSNDEAHHIQMVYGHSSKLLGQPVREEETGRLMVRACDTLVPDNSSTVSAFTYQWWGENWHWKAGDTTPVPLTEGRVYSSSEVQYLYLPTVLGVTLARLLGLGYLPLLMLGRLFNLVLYAFALSLAIRVTPTGKKIFFTVGLLPMALQLAASFSYDAMVLELAFLFVAQVLAMAFLPQRIPAGRWVLLALTGILLAPAKNIYVLLLLSVFILPARRWKLRRLQPTLLGTQPSNPTQQKRRIFLRGVIFAAAGVLAAGVIVLLVGLAKAYILPSLAAPEIPLETQAAQAENIYILPNYTLHYALTHVVDTIRLFLNTVQANTGLYLKMMIGGFLAEPILVTLELSGLLTLVWTALLGLCTLNEAGALHPSRHQRTVGLGVFFLIIAAVYFVFYLWTPYGSTTLWGIQGRYFLPALPLALWALTPTGLYLKKESFSGLGFGCCVASIWTGLQVFCKVLPLH